MNMKPALEAVCTSVVTFTQLNFSFLKCFSE